jgi:hypothetical protein
MSGTEVKVYIPCGGGLGDVVQAYLANPLTHDCKIPDDQFQTSNNHLSLWFRRLEDFKYRHPNSSIIIKMACHNPSAKQLFEYHPAVDGIDMIPYTLDDGAWWENDIDGYRYITYLYDYNNYKWSYPTIYMSDHEALIARQIINRGRYVVLHPFAGLKHREPLGLVWYDKIANEFIRTGYNVIVIGGTYNP